MEAPLGNHLTYEQTQGRRRRPVGPVQLSVPFNGSGELQGEDSGGPVEVTIQATNADGALADWLTDEWWAQLIVPWAERSVVLHVAATPAALLHPVVLHQLEMLRRVVPRWRLVGYVYRDDFAVPGDIELAARAAYDEIRIYDQARPGRAETARMGCGMPTEQVLGEIRREQVRLGTSSPVLVRLPALTTTVARTPRVFDTELRGTPGSGPPMARAEDSALVPRSARAAVSNRNVGG